MESWLLDQVCQQAFEMMLDVKMYMHQQQISADFENQLNREGQQEGLAPAGYRTQKFLLDKRRQIK